MISKRFDKIISHYGQMSTKTFAISHPAKVLRRTIRSGSITQRLRMLVVDDAIRLLSSPIPIIPISCSGILNVVMGGFQNEENSLLSKPTTLTSSGTLMPCSESAVIAPAAI